MLMNKTNIFYGGCGLLTVLTCVGLFALIDQEDQESDYLEILKYNSEQDKTIRAFKPDDKKKIYVDQYHDSYEMLKEQLEPYKDEVHGNYTVNIEPCTEKNAFGIPERQPCIFLQFKGEDSFKPGSFDPENLPSDMPSQLKNYIVANPQLKDSVWLSCDGEFDHNKKNMGKITYHPMQGFSGKSFDSGCTNGACTNTGPLPLVALKMEKFRTHVGVYVLCKAWAKNLANVEKIRFQVYID